MRNAEKIVVLNMGETFVSNGNVVMKCHGLGSCIALFLFDVIETNTAGAHIMLPGSSDDVRLNRNCFALDAIEFLVDAMVAKGSEVANIRAAVVGGANTARFTTIDIGKENTESVLSGLKQKGITITQMNVGSDTPRTAAFSNCSRRAQVTIVLHEIKTTTN